MSNDKCSLLELAAKTAALEAFDDEPRPAMLPWMAIKERKPTRAVVGENLRVFRKRAGFTQDSLGVAAGLSRATVAAIELGRYGSVELSSLDALAAALKVPAFAFLVRADEDPAFWNAFQNSPWMAVANPTDNERRWLLSLPEHFWEQKKPTGRILFELLELRRRHLDST